MTLNFEPLNFALEAGIYYFSLYFFYLANHKFGSFVNAWEARNFTPRKEIKVNDKITDVSLNPDLF